jgi:hypothetical protein
VFYSYDELLTTYAFNRGKTQRVSHARAHESACNSRALRISRRQNSEFCTPRSGTPAVRAKLKSKRRNHFQLRSSSTPKAKPIKPRAPDVLPENPPRDPCKTRVTPSARSMFSSRRSARSKIRIRAAQKRCDERRRDQLRLSRGGFCPTPEAKSRKYRPTAAYELAASQRLAATRRGEIDRITPHEKKEKNSPRRKLGSRETLASQKSPSATHFAPAIPKCRAKIVNRRKQDYEQEETEVTEFCGSLLPRFPPVHI